MIARLEGTLTEKQPNRLIVDIGGVGFDINVPLSTFYTVGEPGSKVALRIHTHVREDALALFGFSSKLELNFFERLIGISGVGTRLALAVLSGLETQELVRAIRIADVARLIGIPGVGKKTAERIILELKDKLPITSEGQAEDTSLGDEAGGLRDDVMSALLNLGYHRALVERAVAEVMTKSTGDFEETLRQALRDLAK
jgi:Holliday junction DNA helicase RuvA